MLGLLYSVLILSEICYIMPGNEPSLLHPQAQGVSSHKEYPYRTGGTEVGFQGAFERF